MPEFIISRKIVLYGQGTAKTHVSWFIILVHKHHTYYEITNKGHYILKDMTEREYIKYIEIDCLKLLSLKRIRKDCPDRCKKLYEMGLMDKNYEPTDMGFAVLDLARRRQIRIL